MAFSTSRLCMWWLFACVYLSTVHIGYCQDNGGESETPTGREREPIEEGMDPLYKMTVTFLDVVQPESKGNLLELVFDSNTTSEDLSNWQMWTKRYVGFLVCAAVGVVFIIVMPIVGLCFCCCRCCGRCGGKPKEKRGKNDRCQLIACSIIFAVLNILILAGMVCAFVTNELVRQQTSQAEDAVVPTLVSNLGRLETFKEQLFSDLNDKVIKRALVEIEDTAESLEAVPSAVTSAISNSSGYSDAIEAFEDLVDRTEQINVSLVQMDGLKEELRTNTITLKTRLGTFKTNFTNSGCGTECNSVNAEVNGLAVDETDIENLPDLDTEINNIQTVLASNLPEIIKEGKGGLSRITTAIYNGTNVVIDLSQAAVHALNSSISSAGDDLEEKLNEAITLQKQIDQVKSYEDDVEKYGDYRFYVGIGLCCVLLLILLFSVLGALFGSCGSPPSDDSGVCNKGVGANLLMASVGFIFLFSWLLMLAVLILFILGGLLQTEVCRLVVDLEDSPAVEVLDNTLEDAVVNKNGSASISFKLSEVLSECKENEAIYAVLSLDNLVNLTDILNLDNYDVKEEINKLKDVNVTVPIFDIYTDDMKNQLDALNASGLDAIDFDKYNDISEGDIVTGDLRSVAQSIDQLAASKTDPLKTTLENFAEELEGIADQELANVRATLTNLKREATTCSDLISDSSDKTFSEQVTEVQSSLQQAEDDTSDKWVDNSANALADVANDIIDDIQVFLNDLVKVVETELARCAPIYNALDDTIQSVCVALLEPFNGFWFSFGWCLFFFIPSSIVAVNLVGLYRRPPVEQHYRHDNKSFDDPNYDAYSGPGDNVPLQQRNGGRYGNSSQNTGYQHDDYTASRAGNYRADKQYDPGFQQRSYAASAPLETPPNPPHYYNGQKYYK